MSIADSPIPTALVAPIIEAYAQGIRPAFSFILISAIFSAVLIPLAAMLFVLSTRNSRRTPIFILNVLSISLGILVGALCNHLTIQSILSPFTGVNPTENLVYNIIYVWMPWITQAVLVLRVIAVFRPAYPRLVDMAALLAFPVIVKATRAAINIFFLVDWKRNTSTGAVNQFDTTTSLKTWMVKTAWILELLDNAYISFLFLWRLGTQSHLFNGEKIGRVDSEISKGSFTSKLKSLFWIASTNFVFPLIFGLCQIILLFRGKNILVAASVEMVNVYVSIISTVFATIWASTVSGKSNVLSSNSDNTKLHLETIKFRRGQEQGATYSHTEVGLQDDSSHTELGSMKKENWGGTIDLA